MMSRKSVSALLFIVTYFTANVVLAVPKLDSEPLPMEDKLLLRAAEATKSRDALHFVLSLTTYQDNEDSSLHYYAPTYTVTPNPAGAATIVTNIAAVTRRSEIDAISAELAELKTEEFMAIRAAYSALTRKLGDPKLTQDERDAINAARRSLIDELDALVEQATDAEGELPGYVLRAKYERMADLFGLSGFSVGLDQIRDVRVRTSILGSLSRSNGGFFSGNLFAGFTADQIGHLVHYKEMRAELDLPQVRLRVLPTESIDFFSLAETFENSKQQDTIGVPLFRSFAGSGDASSATFNFDLTLDGAEKFGAAPPPIIVPIGVKAILTVRPPRFEARLSCDFTTGWSVQGRTDVKDGLIIYNNDVYTSMVAKSVAETNKPCTVTIEGGDGSQEQLAYTQSLIALQNRFTDLYFTRVSVAKQEKMQYWNGVQRDIAQNRHRGSNSGWSGLFARARGLGFIGTIVGAFANASRFYWHTNIQNIRHLDQVKFEQVLISDQNKKIELSLGTANLCLAWNPGLMRYLACDDEEERSAQSVTDAFNEARDSYLCDPSDTTPECADDRNDAAPLDDNDNVAAEDPPPPPAETSLPDEI